MSFFSLMYQMIIGPLEILFEVIYQISFHITGNVGIAIIPVSIAINMLCLPLYLRADSIKNEIREKEKKMAPMVKHIKKTFSGDERYLMLQAYYRIEKYNPIHTLKNSFSLILQIPFFMAAYHFLSHLEVLKGTSFGIISDLGMPDQLLVIGGYSLNVLPITMTIVNLVSSVIYAKKMTYRDRIQLFGLAVLFLFLLYNSPSGLVFYWLLNNIFSFLKNVFLSFTNPRIILKKCLSILGAAFFVMSFVMIFIRGRFSTVLFVVSLLLQIPLLLSIVFKRINLNIDGMDKISSNSIRFFLGCIFMTILTGFLIPSSVISASPMEFIILTDYQSPLFWVLNAFLLSFGVFTFWLGIFYYLMDNEARKITEISLWIIIGISVVNYMMFGTKLGTLSPVLQYKKEPVYSLISIEINILVNFLIIAVFLIIWIKNNKFIKSFIVIIMVVCLGMSFNNIRIIKNQVPSIEEAVSSISDTFPKLTLSKNNKNVIVLVLDKAVSGFIPYIFNEKPELKQKYTGFTWYPNTISYGNMTNVGSPALYGGYEYTPEKMNERNGEWLGDKQNEALKLMPVLFDEIGYKVTVCDPPYAGYQNIPDLSIYNDHPDIATFITGKGIVRTQSEDYLKSKKQLWKRNIFCYSIMKISPLFFQKYIYQGGSYFYSNATDMMQINLGDGETKSYGGQEEFLNAYEVLKLLPDMTNIDKDADGAFFMMHNLTPHEPVILQEPDYTPEVRVDNEEYDSLHSDRFEIDGQVLHVEEEWQIKHYHSNMAALIQVGNWLDYLKQQGVYDNTRIIIVADHGAPLMCLENMLFGYAQSEDEVYYYDIMYTNPLLMVKDFNSSSELLRDDTFMTNADTPLLAFQDIISNPINPFTEKKINNNQKNEKEQHILLTADWQVDVNNGNQFLPGSWFSVSNQNIFDIDNWNYLGDY